MAHEILRLAVTQLTSGEDVDVNLTRVIALTEDAAAQGAELIVFPENTLYFRIESTRGLSVPTLRHLARLSELASSTGVTILLTTPVTAEGNRFANATLLVRPGEPPETVYEKIHLFDVDVPGAPPVRESETFRAGARPRTLEIVGWNLGLSICYDLRFAELYARYAQSVDLILVPSAFLVPTGRAHWHVLLRARAIECQCFVAAPAQGGTHSSGTRARETFGHALAIDPWGGVLVDMGSEGGVRVVEMNRTDLARVRAQIPMARHRRLT